MTSVLPGATDATALARFFRVLADPTRLSLLALLEEGQRTRRRAHRGGRKPAAAGHTHLACLRHCRLVETQRRGREILYRLAVPGCGALLARPAEVAAPRVEHLATCRRIGPEWM